MWKEAQEAWARQDHKDQARTPYSPNFESSRSIRECKIALKSFVSMACWGKGGGGGSRPRFCGGNSWLHAVPSRSLEHEAHGLKNCGELIGKWIANLSVPLFTDSVVHLIFAASVFLHQMWDLIWDVKCEGIRSVYLFEVTCSPARALICSAAQHFVPPLSL